VTPSPGPPRLKKTPAAGHPLPQGGEGGDVDDANRSEHKCRNSRPSPPRGEGWSLRISHVAAACATRHITLGGDREVVCFEGCNTTPNGFLDILDSFFTRLPPAYAGR